MHRWNVAGALQSLNGILLNANVPNGHVNVVFLGPPKLWEFDSNLSNHQENSTKNVLLLFLEFGQEMVKENDLF